MFIYSRNDQTSKKPATPIEMEVNMPAGMQPIPSPMKEAQPSGICIYPTMPIKPSTPVIKPNIPTPPVAPPIEPSVPMQPAPPPVQPSIPVPPVLPPMQPIIPVPPVPPTIQPIIPVPPVPPTMQPMPPSMQCPVCGNMGMHPNSPCQMCGNTGMQPVMPYPMWENTGMQPAMPCPMWENTGMQPVMPCPMWEDKGMQPVMPCPMWEDKGMQPAMPYQMLDDMNEQMPMTDMGQCHNDMEIAYIKKMYPPVCQKIQKYIDSELNQYDHDLSPIYEMYPAAETIAHMANCVYINMKGDLPNVIRDFECNKDMRSPIGGSFYTLVYALLLNELYRKRMRRHFSPTYSSPFYNY